MLPINPENLTIGDGLASRVPYRSGLTGGIANAFIVGSNPTGTSLPRNIARHRH